MIKNQVITFQMVSQFIKSGYITRVQMDIIPIRTRRPNIRPDRAGPCEIVHRSWSTFNPKKVMTFTQVCKQLVDKFTHLQ